MSEQFSLFALEEEVTHCSAVHHPRPIPTAAPARREYHELVKEAGDRAKAGVPAYVQRPVRILFRVGDAAVVDNKVVWSYREAMGKSTGHLHCYGYLFVNELNPKHEPGTKSSHILCSRICGPDSLVAMEDTWGGTMIPVPADVLQAWRDYLAVHVGPEGKTYEQMKGARS